MSNQPAVLMNWNPPVSWRPPFNVTAASAYSSRPPSSQTVQLRSTPASRPPYAFPIATFRSSGYREGGAALPTPVRTEPAANPTTTSANAADPTRRRLPRIREAGSFMSITSAPAHGTITRPVGDHASALSCTRSSGIARRALFGRLPVQSPVLGGLASCLRRGRRLWLSPSLDPRLS